MTTIHVAYLTPCGSFLFFLISAQKNTVKGTPLIIFIPITTLNPVLKKGLSFVKKTLLAIKFPQLPNATSTAMPTFLLYPVPNVMAIQTSVVGMVI